MFLKDIDLGVYEVSVRHDEVNPLVVLLNCNLKVADSIAFGNLNNNPIFETQLNNQPIVFYNTIKAFVINNGSVDNNFQEIEKTIKGNAILKWLWEFNSEINVDNLQIAMFLMVSVDGDRQWVEVKTVNVISANKNDAVVPIEKNAITFFSMGTTKLVIVFIFILFVTLAVRTKYKKS